MVRGRKKRRKTQGGTAVISEFDGDTVRDSRSTKRKEKKARTLDLFEASIL